MATKVATKVDVGLANVDNTSDAQKPISAAQQTALDAKADASAVSSALASKVSTSAIGAPSGVASLGSDGKVPGAQLPSGSPVSSSSITDATAAGRALLTAADVAAQKTALALVKSDVGLPNVDNTSDANKPVSTAQAAAIAAKLDASARGAANGVASLDGSSKILAAQLPSIAITDVFIAADQAAMLALVAEKGDIAVRSDLNKTFALSTNSPGTLADWIELKTPTDAVLSVAGRTGVIVLTAADLSDSTAAGRALLTAANAAAQKTALALVKGDVGLGAVDNTADTAKPVSTAQQAALDLKEDVGSYKAGINSQTGSAYTLVLADKGALIEMSNASANTLTVPPNSSVAFPLKTRIDLVQMGAGQTTIAAGAGVTIRSSSGNLKLTGQYSGATLVKRGTDEWILIGDLSA